MSKSQPNGSPELDPAVVEALVAVMGRDDGPRRLVETAVEFLLDQPVGRFVDLDRVLGLVDASFSPPLVRRAAERHLEASLRRGVARARERGDHLGDYLPESARELLAQVAARPVEISQRSVERWVRHEAVTHLLRAIVGETLDRFLGLLKPDAKGGGLLGQISRGPGMGMLSRIAAQMEAPMRKAATRFVSGSVDAMVGPVVKLFTTPDMAARLGRLRGEAFGAALGLETAEVLSALETLPLEELIDQVPAVVAHNCARPEIRRALLDEIEALLTSEAGHSVREIIGPEAAETYRAQAGALGASLLVGFLSSARLGDLLAEDA